MIRYFYQVFKLPIFFVFNYYFGDIINGLQDSLLLYRCDCKALLANLCKHTHTKARVKNIIHNLMMKGYIKLQNCVILSLVWKLHWVFTVLWVLIIMILWICVNQRLLPKHIDNQVKEEITWHLCVNPVDRNDNLFVYDGSNLLC